jgi:indolepyruvate ferredoxin oxidoreductase alpha subunit
MNEPELLLGNGAIARGLLEAGCEVVTSYPGTPATEILEEVLRQKKAAGIDIHAEWSVNEKVAFDVALAAAMCGKRSATAMKQVGLNVASDSLLSAAYTGVDGGFVVVPCDDPGPQSSQTEQDSRLFALFAKVPVLDPSSPREAREMVRAAFEISERHSIPVMVRPTTRVCHARQPILPHPFDRPERRVRFHRNPARWAATPRHRLTLHQELNTKLEAIRAEFEESTWIVEEGPGSSLGIIAAGPTYGTIRDLLREDGREVDILKVGAVYPLPVQRIARFIARHERIIVLEEPDFAIEIQILDRLKVEGRLTGRVPSHGELTPEAVAAVLDGIAVRSVAPTGPAPRLCPGCGHRAAFFALHTALPNAIVAGDIGCYTLGINQKTLDTCLDMGASITLAQGFYLVHRRDGLDTPIVAVIGDSTFFHAGIPALLNAVVTDSRIIVVVLDNGTVAMTGHQPTPAGSGASIELIARGVGVRFVETIDPYRVEDLVALLKRARAFTRAPSPDGGVALVVARRPCALIEPPEVKIPVEVVADGCDGCGYCLKFCECPGLLMDEATGKVRIDPVRCIDCGNCIPACPWGAIIERKAGVIS